MREALKEMPQEEMQERTSLTKAPSDAFAGYYETDMKRQLADQTEDGTGFEYNEADRLAAYKQLRPAKGPGQNQRATLERTRHEEEMSQRTAMPLSVMPQNPWTSEPDFSRVDFDGEDFAEEFPESGQLASQMMPDATGRRPRRSSVIADPEHRFGDGEDLDSPWRDAPTVRGGRDET